MQTIHLTKDSFNKIETHGKRTVVRSGYTDITLDKVSLICDNTPSKTANVIEVRHIRLRDISCRDTVLDEFPLVTIVMAELTEYYGRLVALSDVVSIITFDLLPE